MDAQTVKLLRKMRATAAKGPDGLSGVSFMWSVEEQLETVGVLGSGMQ